MRVLITGGTGTIGRRLVKHLISHGYAVTVLSRQPYKPANLPAKIVFLQWDSKTAKGWGHHLEEVDAVVNLAGAGIADAPWTEERKALIRSSRIEAGEAVCEAFEQATNKPPVLVQASAVGYYGLYDNGPVLTEDSPPGEDFLGSVCQDWENVVKPVAEMPVRLVTIRTGIVLDPQGGAFPRLVLPFKFFAGGPLGDGCQWLPWIHHFDEVEAIRFLIETEAASGPFNLCAPNPLRNRDFAAAIGEVMGRPAFLPAPAFAVKTALGEMSTAVLKGQQAVPKRLQELDFSFKYPHAKDALKDLL